MKVVNTTKIVNCKLSYTARVMQPSLEPPYLAAGGSC